LKKVKYNRAKIIRRNEKTAAVFDDFVLQSNDIFIHCARIPDVMMRIVKAREILRKYKIKIPAWMFGLMHKGETFESGVHLQMMSFLMNVGLYDRLVRIVGAPDFLIGSSPALQVSARVKTFEKSVIKIFCGTKFKQSSVSIYQKKTGKYPRFSLLHFSDKVKETALRNTAKEYGIEHCILIPPSSWGMDAGSHQESFVTIRSLIEMDPRLAWFWPILKRRQVKFNKVISTPFIDTFFH